MDALLVLGLGMSHGKCTRVLLPETAVVPDSLTPHVFIYLRLTGSCTLPEDSGMEEELWLLMEAWTYLYHSRYSGLLGPLYRSLPFYLCKG